MSKFMNITDSALPIESSLALPRDEVALWRIDLDAIQGEESRWQKLLSLDESARASRYHFVQDRQRFVASRACLRTILASYLAVDAANLNFSYSAKEKPSLGPPFSGSGITFNISHSGGAALFAFARQRDLGVDVEQVRDNRDLEAIARRFFSTNEQSQLAALSGDEKVNGFFRCWTRKEAYIKATGDGLSLPLAQFDVSLEAGNTDALVTTRLDNAEAGRWLLVDVPAGPGYTGALCVRGRDWKLNGWW